MRRKAEIFGARAMLARGIYRPSQTEERSAMMGIAEIRAANRSATANARRTGRKPWEPSPEERERLKAGDSKAARFPYLADYVPRGWERTEQEPIFVDISGVGLDSEPALTAKQWAREIGNDPSGTAYAVIEAGQFQGYLARYRRKAVKWRKGMRARYWDGPVPALVGLSGTVVGTRKHGDRVSVRYDIGSTFEAFSSSLELV
jgi:hypothetical protein